MAIDDVRHTYVNDAMLYMNRIRNHANLY